MITRREFAEELEKQENKLKSEYIEVIKKWLSEFNIKNCLLFLGIGSKKLTVEDEIFLEGKMLKEYDLRIISEIYGEIRTMILKTL